MGWRVLDLAKIMPAHITANPALWTTTQVLAGWAKGGSVGVTIGYLMQSDKGVQLPAPVASHIFAASVSCMPVGGATPRSQSTDIEGVEGLGAAASAVRQQQVMEVTEPEPEPEPSSLERY